MNKNCTDHIFSTFLIYLVSGARDAELYHILAPEISCREKLSQMTLTTKKLDILEYCIRELEHKIN